MITEADSQAVHCARVSCFNIKFAPFETAVLKKRLNKNRRVGNKGLDCPICPNSFINIPDSRSQQLRALDGHISQFYEDFVTGFLERMLNAKSQPLELTHVVTKNVLKTTTWV